MGGIVAASQHTHALILIAPPVCTTIITQSERRAVIPTGGACKIFVNSSCGFECVTFGSFTIDTLAFRVIVVGVGIANITTL